MGHRTEESLRDLIRELDSNVGEEVLENTPSFRLASEPEDYQYGKCRL